MNLRACFGLFAGTLLVLGGAPRSAASYADSSQLDADLPRQTFAAAIAGLRTPSFEPPLAKPVKLRFAHAIIVRTSPEKGRVAPENIGKVEVWYDAGIRNEFVALAVINAAGDRVDKRDAAIDTFDPSHVSTTVEVLTPGEYTVRYRALSADGHQVSGAWVFEVQGQ